MPGKEHSSPEPRFGKQKIILLALALLALGTVFVLPQFVSEPWVGGDGDQAEATPPASDIKPSTVAEKTRYRQESQAVLAKIIAGRDKLQEQNVGEWAGIEFRQAMALVDSGDEQYSYGEYQESLAEYEKALGKLEALEELGRNKLADAISAGQAALESLNVIVANNSAAMARTIAPDDAAVMDLVARAEKLPALKEQLERGHGARAAGSLQVARAAYTKAMEIDPQHKQAGESLAALERDIVDSRFRQHMSRGYAALENGDFDGAREAFMEADGVYPGNEAVVRALAQVENRDAQVTVSGKIRQATELEAREEWQRALEIYEALIEEDASLTEARAKLVPVKVRADLDEKLSGIIEDPLSLASQSAYRTAQAALQDARGISNQGTRLTGQIAEIEKLLKQAVTPVNVVFQSDSQTHVVLFRIKDLGQFNQTSLVLKPGRYVAAGTRSGYRDVRVEFTITGEPLAEPIVVRCEESI